MNTKLLISTSIIALIITTCKNLAEPEPEPGRRDYVWTIDTISVYGGVNSGVYAASADDIWVAFDASDEQKLLHYDGTQWKTIYLLENYQPCRIQGKTYNDIWILPKIGDLYRFNGFEWKTIQIKNLTESERIVFYKIAWGEKGDIYAAGTGCNQDFSKPRCVIAKFVNDSWQYIKIPKIEGGFVEITYDKPLKTYYLLCWSLVSTAKIYSFKDNKLELFKEGNSINNKEIDNQTYFCFQGYVYQYRNNHLRKFLDDRIESQNNFEVYGRNHKDIFFTPQESHSIRHYNGTDIQTLINIGTDEVFGPASIGKNVAAFVTFNRYSYEYYNTSGN